MLFQGERNNVVVVRARGLGRRRDDDEVGVSRYSSGPSCEAPAYCLGDKTVRRGGETNLSPPRGPLRFRSSPDRGRPGGVTRPGDPEEHDSPAGPVGRFVRLGTFDPALLDHPCLREATERPLDGPAVDPSLRAIVALEHQHEAKRRMRKLRSTFRTRTSVGFTLRSFSSSPKNLGWR